MCIAARSLLATLVCLLGCAASTGCATARGERTSPDASQGTDATATGPRDPAAPWEPTTELSSSHSTLSPVPTTPLYANIIAPPAGPATDDREFTLSVAGTFLYGSASGYVQTPSGGEPGTTSKERPKFSEIGIDNASIGDGQLTATFGEQQRNEVYVGGQFIRLSGSDTLGSDLVSHGVTFPAGSHVSSDVQLDWYRVGYRYRLDLNDVTALCGIPTNPGLDDFSLYPSVGGAFLNFDYRLDGPGGQRASRSYIKGNVQFGLELEWRPNRGPFSVTLGGLAAPNFSSLPGIYYEELAAHYRFLDTRKVDATATLGVALEQMDYEDNQRVSNHIHADFGPLLVAGVELKF
jgi:hypothetical protein